MCMSRMCRNKKGRVMEKRKKVVEIKKEFSSFIDFKFFKKNYRKTSILGNNLLFLRKKLEKNINESGIENLGTDFMLKDMGRGNFKFSRRFGWLYRHYIWASKVPSISKRRARIVDIGCDVGEIRKIISRSFYTTNPLYLGIDLDHKRLSSGAEEIQMRIPAIYVQHDVTLGLKFIKTESVDIVYAGEIIEHFKRKFGKAMLEEIRRILKPKGRFLISTPNKERTKGYKFHIYEYKIPELVKMVEECGLKVESVYGWQTTEKEIKKKGGKLWKTYQIFSKKIHKDLVVAMFAFLDPSVSDAFCIEGRKK